MADVLKGNFTPRSGVQVDTGDVQSLEDQFEREALKRLGGSIAFVSKIKGPVAGRTRLRYRRQRRQG